ncbi:FKBP-type peptidyl-prolyl cis-trans isomerase [Litoribrevibacter euphylliae]|uniref:Peptidyl-prolyl cis-trans isomerase n=1 Tax=Litoribrevibacter euphylliae TaxID=1834034 RepID=A0ABV7HFK9_9GAMM
MMNLLVIVVTVFLVFMFTRRFQNAKKQAQINIQKGQEYIDLHKNDSNVEQTESGMLYQVLRKGTGTEHPSVTNKVTVHYHGTLIDGTVFDSSVDRGQTIDFFLNQVIPGWTEGLQKMVVGEKARLSIPSHLAYGDRPVGAIPGGSLLIFDVELIAIN